MSETWPNSPCVLEPLPKDSKIDDASCFPVTKLEGFLLHLIQCCYCSISCSSASQAYLISMLSCQRGRSSSAKWAANWSLPPISISAGKFNSRFFRMNVCPALPVMAVCSRFQGCLGIRSHSRLQREDKLARLHGGRDGRNRIDITVSQSIYRIRLYVKLN